jgi:hypothetical protein
VAGLGVTEFFGAAVFLAFALFSFLSIFVNSKFPQDLIGKAFRLGLRPQALLIAAVSLLAGGSFLLVLVLIGTAIGRSAQSTVPVVMFTAIGAIGLVYALYASAYILNVMALSGLRENRRVGFGEALKAFFANQGQLMLLPIVIGGIVLVEMGLLLLFGLGGRSEGFFLLSALFYLPFLPLNLVLFGILFLGCGVFLPVMIEQKKGAFATLKAVTNAVKQQPLRLITVQVAVITFLGTAGLVMYLIFKAAGSVGVPEGTQSPLMIVVGEFFKNPLGVFEAAEGGAVLFIGALLLTILVVLMLAVGAAIIWNLNMCLYSAFYLGHIKDSVDFEEKLLSKKK